MATLEIVLARHGESEGNKAGYFGSHGPTPLTEHGRWQAARLAEVLRAAPEPITAIHSSDLPRALQTAEPTAAAFDLPITTTSALRERSVGILSGVTFIDAQARHPDVFATLMARTEGASPPEGETHATVLSRAGEYVKATIAAAPDKAKLLFVSHSVTINLIVRQFLRLETHTYAAFTIRTDNCALHRIRISENNLTVVKLNDTAHLR
jgi:probable phosphoglycerate mutase